MDKEKRIAELEERKRQIDVEIAFENGVEIEYENISHSTNWTDCPNPLWGWGKSNYRIKKEPKRIPFDGSDAFDLVGQKFVHVNPKITDSTLLCVQAGSGIVVLGTTEFSYEILASSYLKWNDLLKVFEPCNKAT